MPIRPATYRDISSISTIFVEAFREESLKSILFPYRDEYPGDYVRAWREKLTERYWDYRKVFMVTYEVENEKEELTGVAVWTRNGDGWESLWGIRGKWDLRLIILPFIRTYHKLRRMVFTNRASAQPTASNPHPLVYTNWESQVYPFISHYLVPPSPSSSPSLAPAATPSSAPSTQLPVTSDPTTPLLPSKPNHTTNPSYFELTMLAVRPTSQNHGAGRSLCAWGLGLARAANLPALVVASEGKERFYQRCGFVNLVGWACEGDGNPLAEAGVKGGAILWTDLPKMKKMEAGKEEEEGEGEEVVETGA